MKLEKVGIWKVYEIRKSRKSEKLGNWKKQEIRKCRKSEKVGKKGSWKKQGPKIRPKG